MSPDLRHFRHATQPPALLSFSGGRTSAYMLRLTLDAYGGGLPPDVFAVFANTGRERPETLDFVQDCSERWGVPVRWVEYGRGEVTYDTASRNGEPFTALIRARKFLPNPVTRFCTSELKVRPMKQFMLDRGFEHWDVALGIRADEPRRVANQRAPSRERFEKTLPLADAGVSVRDVAAFWACGRQGFDLQLRPHEGNCDLGFLKGAGKLTEIMERRPDLVAWWAERETETGARFRSDRPGYSAMLDSVERQARFDFGALDEREECLCHD